MLIVDDDRDSHNLLKSLTNRTSARGSSLSGGGWPSTLKGSTKVTLTDCIGRFDTAEADSTPGAPRNRSITSSKNRTS